MEIRLHFWNLAETWNLSAIMQQKRNFSRLSCFFLTVFVQIKLTFEECWCPMQRNSAEACLTPIYSPLMGPEHVIVLFLISDGQMVRDQAGTNMSPQTIDKMDRMRAKQLEMLVILKSISWCSSFFTNAFPVCEAD